MTITSSSPALQQADYEALESALMATARGRLFLAEYARRARGSDNARLLAAIDRLGARLDAQAGAIAGLAGEAVEGDGPDGETTAHAEQCAPVIAAPRPEQTSPADDPRLGALSRLDGLPLVDRLALFS
ncbi:hypothetical protein [Methylocystis iwaonis]|uniref:Uncharacterized protein n=1 Tax=Methylocystis iwaonis TaxID=2885079 RepID=A0ABM8E402_9HYPH|nr:hypothetical protein [Methylocystis iwaonis]BDV32556.1 hypothetical protein SS37A_00850 [Methylocystis iwaonis]